MSRPTPPRTPYEEVIAAIWRDVLGHSQVGVLDDFFELGGHSLLAPRVVAHIRKTLGISIAVRDFFQSPTVAALASAIADGSAEHPAVTRRPPDAPPVLSYDQERLWLENQLLPGPAYNVHGRRRLLGPIDVAALDASIRAILVRHEALRTRFPTVDGRPVQVVDDPDEDWHVTLADVGEAAGDREAAAHRLLDEECAATFDLAGGPLLRCLLVRLSDTEHLLGVTVHHIICDAWSVGLFVRELSALYQAGGDAGPADLPELPVQYRDYAVWQRGWLAGDRLAALVDYWRDHLAGAPPALALPAARRRLPQRRTGAGRLRFGLSEQETSALRTLCRRQGVTSFMVLLAGLATVLGRWSGQRDIVVGVPVASRGDAGTEHLIGFFVNTLPLRVDLSGEPTFADLLGRVRRVALDGYAHADAPLDVVIKETQVVRDPRRTPLFQAILNVIDGPQVERTSGVVVQPLDTPALPSKVDLALTAQESGGGLRLQLDFDADRYQVQMMRVLAGRLGTLLGAVVQDPGRNLLDYALEGSSGVETRPAPRLVVDVDAAFLDRVAVVDQYGEWTYRWLAEAADRVALVVAEHGADRVGLLRRPSAAFVAAVVGCAKAGTMYSVLAPDSPVPVEYLGVSVVLDVAPGDPVTSGTVDLSGVLGEVVVERCGQAGEDRIAVLSGNPGLLGSALSTMVSGGATLAIPNDSTLSDPDALVKWLQSNAVSVAYLCPPLLRAITGTGAQLPLRRVFVENTGELISHDVDALRRTAPACRCVGVYGTGADGRPLATYEVPEDWRLESAPLRVPLGSPADGVELRHPAGQPAAVGEVAEICAGPDRTGDLGRRWADGTLEYVPPADDADRAETLAALRDLPGVRDAVVTEHAGEDGGTTMVGYLAGLDPALDTAGVRPRLMTQLPAHLTPERVAVLDRLPLTPDGEYDLAALADPLARDDAAGTYVAPRTPMERRLTEILEELLGAERVGVHDSFFELGGFSLLATRLTGRIRETFQVELSLRDVFESVTVDGLAQLILRAQAELSGAGRLEALLNEIEPPAAEPGR